MRTARRGQPKTENEICAQQKRNPQMRLQCGFKRIKTESKKKKENKDLLAHSSKLLKSKNKKTF